MKRLLLLISLGLLMAGCKEYKMVYYQTQFYEDDIMLFTSDKMLKIENPDVTKTMPVILTAYINGHTIKSITSIVGHTEQYLTNDDVVSFSH